MTPKPKAEAAVVWEGLEAYRPHLVAIDSLEPWPDNPRRGDVESIADMLRRFGQLKPVVVRGKRIVAGHHLVLAALELGWSHVAAVDGEFKDETAARVFLLGDNRVSELGENDDDALAAQLSALASFDGTGYTEEAAQAIMRLSALQPDVGDDDEEPPAPEPRAEPKSKLGEVYELGPHRIMCGDATKQEDMAVLMGEERADVVWTDPPYAIYGSSSGLSASITDDKIVRPFFRDALSACERWTPFFAPIFVCCDWRSWPSWWEVSKLTRVEPKNLLVWDKGGAGLGNNFANTYELVGYFIHLPEQRVMTAARKAGIRPILKPNVIRANRVGGAERQHNAAKPVGLIEEILTVSSEPDGLVLDLFAGSGSTLIAAHRLGRRCFLMEVDPVYCDVVRQRYADVVGDASLAP